MKGVFGVIGLVVALAIVGLVVKKQLAAQGAMRAPAAAAGASSAGAASAVPPATVREQSLQTQQQVRDQVQQLMQQARPMPEGQ